MRDKKTEPMSYARINGGNAVLEDLAYWSGIEYSSEDIAIRKILIKAFKKRKNVKVGDTFVLPNTHVLGTGLGVNRIISYNAKRTSGDVVEVTDKPSYRYSLGKYVISSSRESLNKYHESEFKPFLYLN